jgi:ATP-binding cassette subfamily B protein
MTAKRENGSKSFFKELRVIGKRARQDWQLVPRKHKWALGAAVAVMTVTAACNTGNALLVGAIVDGVQRGSAQGLSPAELYRSAGLYLLLISGAYVLRETLNVARRHLVENSCSRIEKVLTVKLVSHLMRVDLATFTHEKVGALHGRISRSVVGFTRFLRLAFLDFFPAIATGDLALTAALTKQPWLGLAMVGVIPVSLWLTVRQIVSEKGVRLTLIRSREDMDGTLVEQLGGLDYVRAANTQEHEIHRIGKAAERRRVKEMRHHFRMSLFGCAKAINEGFFHVLVLAFAIYLAVHSRISLGDILTFSMLFLNVMAPLNEVHRVVDECHECSLEFSDLLEMLAEPVDCSFSPPRVEEPVIRDGRPLIEVEDLQVEYRTADGKARRAVDGVSLTVRHGETIGVAGRSGSGKTTWLRVLMRLTHPTAGRVRLGGAPLEAVSREAVGRLIGYVGQTPFVFAGTVAEDISYGSDKADPEDVHRAARLAHIHDEIMQTPGCYEAAVSERGQNLSGGQRQRLALARVFLKNPQILILDEGTSALDTIGERNIQRAIAEARVDRTVILVVHRLSTLREADRIYVFDEGKIVEQGNYAELLRQGGLFTQLAACGEESSSPAGVAARAS